MTIVAVWFLVGCGGSTRGASCELVAAAGCDQALQCNLTFTARDLCIDLSVDACCRDDETCDEPQDGREAGEWEDCADDIDDQACEDAGDVPPSCDALD